VTIVLWTAIGITLGAAVLHATLAMQSRNERAHLYFACMMVFLALNFYCALGLDGAATADDAVEAVRRQVAAILGCHGCMLLFVGAYTRVQLPRSLVAAYWCGLAVLFVANLIAPYGLSFSDEPQLVRSTFLGAPYQSVSAPPMSILEHAYVLYFSSVLVLALICAVNVYRRGERERALALGIAVALLFAHAVADTVRDAVGGSWPYVGELGFVAWALIMSVQLGHDFRGQAEALRKAIAEVDAQAARLRLMLVALQMLEQRIHAPLDQLESRVPTLAAGTSREAANLERICRALTRLRELSRLMPNLHVAPTRAAEP
jgi:hypothetical protein